MADVGRAPVASPPQMLHLRAVSGPLSLCKGQTRSHSSGQPIAMGGWDLEENHPRFLTFWDVTEAPTQRPHGEELSRHTCPLPGTTSQRSHLC